MQCSLPSCLFEGAEVTDGLVCSGWTNLRVIKETLQNEQVQFRRCIFALSLQNQNPILIHPGVIIVHNSSIVSHESMQSHGPSLPIPILHFHDSSIVPRENVQSHCLISSCLLLPRDSLQHLNKLPPSITHRNLPRRPLLPIPQHHIRTKLHQQPRRILRPAHSSTVQR